MTYYSELPNDTGIFVNSRWQTRKERPNRTATNGYIEERAERPVSKLGME